MADHVANIEVLYQVSSFSSFYEAAFGLNLAYSLIQQIHNAGLDKYNKFKSKAFEEWHSGHCEPDNEVKGTSKEYDRIVRVWNEQENTYVRHSKRAVNVSRYWAFTVAFILLIALAFIGFNPDYEILYYQAYIFMAASIFPTIVSILYMYIYWKLKRNELKKKILNQNGTFEAVKRIFQYGKESEE